MAPDVLSPRMRSPVPEDDVPTRLHAPLLSAWFRDPFPDSLGAVRTATHQRAEILARLLVMVATVGTVRGDDEPASVAGSLPSYLETLNVLPQSASVPGAAFPSDPTSSANESVKAWLARRDITYTVFQTFNFADVPRRIQDPAFAAIWSGQAFANFGLVESASLGGTQGWITTEFPWTVGMGARALNPSLSSRIGSALQPDGTTMGDGVWVAELAWAQSFLGGEWVVLAGMVDQGNYLDVNTYANNQFTELSNQAFVNNQALPTPGQGLALNLQWQPSPRFYAQAATFPANSTPGSAPFSGLSFRNWATQLEAGWITPEFLGQGQNIVRVQPFVATVDGSVGAGIGLNLEQQLGGPEGRWGWFCRAGACQSGVAISGFETQVSTGVALEAPNPGAPLKDSRASRWSVGAVWGRPRIPTGVNTGWSSCTVFN